MSVTGVAPRWKYLERNERGVESTEGPQMQCDAYRSAAMCEITRITHTTDPRTPTRALPPPAEAFFLASSNIPADNARVDGESSGSRSNARVTVEPDFYPGSGDRLIDEYAVFMNTI